MSGGHGQASKVQTRKLPFWFAVPPPPSWPSRKQAPKAPRTPRFFDASLPKPTTVTFSHGKNGPPEITVPSRTAAEGLRRTPQYNKDAATAQRRRVPRAQIEQWRKTGLQRLRHRAPGGPNEGSAKGADSAGPRLHEGQARGTARPRRPITCSNMENRGVFPAAPANPPVLGPSRRPPAMGPLASPSSSSAVLSVT